MGEKKFMKKRARVFEEVKGPLRPFSRGEDNGHIIHNAARRNAWAVTKKWRGERFGT